MLHWNSFQSYCVDPWSGCCSGLPGTFWLCRWSAKWVVVAGFGVDVLLVSNWLDVFANIGTESSIAIRNPSHHKIQRLWKHFRWHRLRVLASPCDVRLPLQNFSRTGFSNGFCYLCFCFKVLRIFGGHRAPKRQWTSQPVSGSSWRRGKHSRTAEVPKAPPNAAYRLISMLESAALVLEAMHVNARIEC